MKKVLVGLSALLVATGVGFAADCSSGGKKCGCKPKKYRIVYVTAHNPDTLYDNSVFETTEVGPDYRMVPIERSSAMRDRRVSYEDDDQYYVENRHDPYDDEYIEPRRPARRAEPRSSSKLAIGPYVGGRLGVNLWSWENKYKATPASAIADSDADHDDYLFEPVFGGALFAGFHIDDAWRADLEVGYAGKFSDTDNGFAFKMASQHVTLNGYYDFSNGLYLGLGAGVAFTKAELDWEYFVANSGSKSRTSVLGAGMVGYVYHMTDNVALDFRYRLSGYAGPKWSRGTVAGLPPLAPGLDPLEEFEIKTGLIWDNAFTIGIRFEF